MQNQIREKEEIKMEEGGEEEREKEAAVVATLSLVAL